MHMLSGGEADVTFWFAIVHRRDQQPCNKIIKTIIGLVIGHFLVTGIGGARGKVTKVPGETVQK